MQSLNLSNNPICGPGVLAILTDNLPSECTITFNEHTACACEEFDETDGPSLSDNKVCVETAPDSDHWYTVCTSDTYTVYSDAETFSCDYPSGTTDCSGGCKYGQACMVDSSSNGDCYDVVIDDTLHAYLLGIMDSEDCTSTTFGIASLKHLQGSISLPNTTTLSNLYGMQHAINVQSIDFSNSSSLVDVASLGTLTKNLKELDLHGCSFLGESLDNIIGLAPSLQYFDLGGIPISDSIATLTQFSSLVELRINECGLSSIPDLSASNDSLTLLDISDNSDISSLCPIVEYGITHLVQLYATSNSIRDPTALYELDESLCSLDLRDNKMCELDDAEALFFSEHFTNVLCADGVDQMYDLSDQQETCDCSSEFSLTMNKTCSSTSYDGQGTDEYQYQVTCSEYSYRVKDPSNDDGFSCIEFESEDEDVESLILYCASCVNNNTNMECVDISSYDSSYSSSSSSSSSPSSSIECVCMDGWYGSTCTSECPVIVGSDNSEDKCGSEMDPSQGSCNTLSHSCECELGWGGTNCSEDQCSMDSLYGFCNGSGSCVQLSDTSSYCECNQGYGGENCPSQTCSRDENDTLCSGVGSCEKDSSGEYHCTSCAYGYVLNASSSDCLPMCDDEDYCGSNGTCVGSNKCLCDSGYSGDQCEEYSCGDPMNPCSGSTNGQCIMVDYTHHECACEIGWNEDDCGAVGCPIVTSTDGDPVASCGEHGTCVLSDTGVSACECDPGWSDESYCSSLNGLCGSDTICSDHGSCIYDSSSNVDVCKCLDGWSGTSCENVLCGCVDSNDHMECVDGEDAGTLVCACKKGWSGDECNVDACDCHSKGECVDDTETSERVCQCYEFFSGDSCEECASDDPNDCLSVSIPSYSDPINIPRLDSWPMFFEKSWYRMAGGSLFGRQPFISVPIARSSMNILADDSVSLDAIRVIQANSIVQLCLDEISASMIIPINGGIFRVDSVGPVFCYQMDGTMSCRSLESYEDWFSCSDDGDASTIKFSMNDDSSVPSPPPVFSGSAIGLKQLMGAPPCSEDVDGVVVYVFEDVFLRCIGHLSEWAPIILGDEVDIQSVTTKPRSGIIHYYSLDDAIHQMEMFGGAIGAV
ncbi:hypothetical protein ADUPG1_006972 [Aduncisulcus paluster]|uniref:EGF-like domain-containing protein n=1 Tax=Aduncisulcus paluster TaxID=2918883 RepID=A0ABQ5KKA5_9EUKA|nr:hypothetical protein ADUPG1_006972 [Aduncisulcus paluster]